MPQLQSLPSPRLLVLESKSFSKPPPPKPYMQEYASTSQLHLSLNLPPQNPTCKSMPQPHSFTSPRLLVTIPSHFLNLPPKTLHARVFLNFTASPIQDFLLDSKSFSKPPPQKPYMQEYSSTSQPPPSKTSCHDSKSFSKPPPPKTLHARVFLNFTASPLQDFLLDSKSFSKPPPKPYMQEYASTSQTPPSKTSWAAGAVAAGSEHQSKEKTRG